MLVNDYESQAYLLYIVLYHICENICRETIVVAPDDGMCRFKISGVKQSCVLQ